MTKEEVKQAWPSTDNHQAPARSICEFFYDSTCSFVHLKMYSRMIQSPETNGS